MMLADKQSYELGLLHGAAAAMRQALEALEGGADSWQLVGPAIDALKAALAEEAMQRLTDVQQEIQTALAEPTVTSDCPNSHQLTDEVIATLWHQNGGFHHHFARAIERWLKGNP